MTGYRFAYHPERFTVGKKRRPRRKDNDHLDFIRSLPCIICGKAPRSEAAHIRSTKPGTGKRHTGMQEKSGDSWTLPLCTEHHREQHRTNELTWWQSYGLDAHKIASYLWQSTGDEEAGLAILRENPATQQEERT